MSRFGPASISATLCVALSVLALLTYAVTRGGDDQAPVVAAVPVQPGTASSGEALACPGGGQVEASYNLVGSEFRLVGRVASVDGGQLLVKGPERYVTVSLADGAQVDVTLASGLLVRASGTFDADGGALASDVEPACGSAVVAEVTPVATAIPQPTPGVVVEATERATAGATPPATVTPSKTVKPKPTRGGVQPVAVEVTSRPTRSPARR